VPPRAEPWSFEGRVMVVTGAAQGVGEATARLMAARGAAGLALLDRNRAGIEALAEELGRAGTPCEPIPVELERVEECFAAIDRAAARFGTLSGLVNAAALTDRGTIDNTTVELFDRLIAVDARAPFFLIQRILPHLRRAGGGTIVNLLSLTIWSGPAYLAAYVAAKGALAAITRNVAAAVIKDRVRVNGLNLGWTVTPAERRVQTEVHGRPPDWPEIEGARQPMGRLLTPEDAARAICFLASDESALMTGAIVDFDQRVVGVTPPSLRFEPDPSGSSGQSRSLS
jgi:NAD(P)-dependent dehydrogenase (short-subunit alcohol dehydrogenase family)